MDSVGLPARFSSSLGARDVSFRSSPSVAQGGFSYRSVALNAIITAVRSWERVGGLPFRAPLERAKPRSSLFLLRSRRCEILARSPDATQRRNISTMTRSHSRAISYSTTVLLAPSAQNVRPPFVSVEDRTSSRLRPSTKSWPHANRRRAGDVFSNRALGHVVRLEMRLATVRFRIFESTLRETD